MRTRASRERRRNCAIASARAARSHPVCERSTSNTRMVCVALVSNSSIAAACSLVVSTTRYTGDRLSGAFGFEVDVSMAIPVIKERKLVCGSGRHVRGQQGARVRELDDRALVRATIERLAVDEHALVVGQHLR